MLLYNKLNAECWIIRAPWGYCPGLDLPLKKAGRQAGHFLAQLRGKPGKALLQDSFPLTAAFSSNWISAEAQSAFTNAYENVFFASLPFPSLLVVSLLSMFPSGSISMLKINETDRLLTQFDAPQLCCFYKYWNHLSADRQKKDRIVSSVLTPNLNLKPNQSADGSSPRPIAEASDVGARCLSLPAGEGGHKRSEKYSIINKWE